MTSFHFTNEQARNFILLKQGLIGAYKFSGKKGVLDFIRQAGCIQYDPIDVCGKNPELVLQSRVAGFTKDMLSELLYQDRALVDYFDKNMAIFAVEDWRYFARTRRYYEEKGQSRDIVDAAAGPVLELIRQRGYVCARDVDYTEKVDWSWSPTSLSRAVLETLYFRGELVLHHKKGTMKYYMPASGAISGDILYAEDPNKTEEDFMRWMIARRIGAVGLLWNRPSDAWLGIGGLSAEKRNKAFSELFSEGWICPCRIEGVSETFYILNTDVPLARQAVGIGDYAGRLEFIAPLDNMMWDRKLIRELFGFEYKWEIYTPEPERKYGYYVLPVLYGNRFVGRIELVADKKEKRLIVKNFWLESGFKKDRSFNAQLKKRLRDFAAFNGCHVVS